MKDIGIITINDNDNYGNRLQNYAVNEILKKINTNPITIKNVPLLNKKENVVKDILRLLKFYSKSNKLKRSERNKITRKEFFDEFNKNIVYSKKNFNWFSFKDKYDYYLTGSDQVWNCTIGRLSDVDLLNFTNNSKKVAFSASFGIKELPKSKEEYVKENLKNYKAISVREDAAKKIVEDLTGRTDIEVLVDPTMLLTSKEWDKVIKEPKQLNCKKYILNYFLGELPNEWKEEIDKVAEENNCEIINILDPNSPFYQTGPSEFLYLEKNAFIICTDSFHSCVFSIIYDKPFVVFDRKQNGMVSMNSRIDTLLTKFNLQNRRFTGKITPELLTCNYTEAKNILKKEKEKSINFLKKALDIEEGANNE